MQFWRQPTRHLRGCHMAPPAGLGGVAALPPNVPNPPPCCCCCCLQGQRPAKACRRYCWPHARAEKQLMDAARQQCKYLPMLAHPQHTAMPCTHPNPPPNGLPPPGEACWPKAPKPPPCCTAAPKALACPKAGWLAAAPKPEEGQRDQGCEQSSGPGSPKQCRAQAASIERTITSHLAHR